MSTDAISPEFQFVYAETNAFIVCVSYTDPIWLFNGQPVKSGIVIANNIVLYPAHLEDSGIYTCEGTLPNEEHFSANSELLVASM